MQVPASTTLDDADVREIENYMEGYVKVAHGTVITVPQSDPRRWVVLFCFCTLTFSNAAAFVVYSPILSEAMKYYGCSNQQVVWLINSYYLVYICLSLFVMPTLETWKLNHCFYASSFVNLTGAWVRYFGFHKYAVSLLGNILISAAQLWSLQSPGIIAERWFPSEQRVMATSIAFFANIIGLSFGYLLSAYVVKENAEDITNVQLYQAIIMSAPFVLMLAFFRDDKPSHAPNLAANTIKMPIFQSLLEIYKHPRNILNLVVLSCFLGVSWTFIGVLDNILAPLDFDVITIGYVGLCMNIAGTVGGLASSVAMERDLLRGRTPRYDFFIKIYATLSMAAVGALAIILLVTNQIAQWIIFFVTAIIGLGFNAFVPFALQAFTESVFPVNEIVSFTSYFQIANAAGLCGNLISNQGVWVIALILVPFFVYIVFFYKTDLVRFRAECKLDTKLILSITASKLQQQKSDKPTPPTPSESDSSQIDSFLLNQQ